MQKLVPKSRRGVRVNLGPGQREIFLSNWMFYINRSTAKFSETKMENVFLIEFVSHTVFCLLKCLVSCAVSGRVLGALGVVGVLLETLPVVQGGNVVGVFPLHFECAVKKVPQVAEVGPEVQDGVPQVRAGVALNY